MALSPPTPLIIALLGDLDWADSVGGRISVSLDSVLPCARVAHVGDQAAISDWEAAPMFQVEVWATDAIEAEQLAWDLRNAWPSAALQRIGDAAVHGRWVVTNPIELPARLSAEDADEDTDLARFSITVAFRMTGATSHG